jgi:hypothetical protein
VLSDGQEIVVTSDQIVGAARRGASEQIVVVRVSTDRRRRRVRKQDRLGPQELEKRVSVVRSNPILLRDLRANQYLGHFFDLAGNQKKEERPATPSLDELPL